MAQEGRVEEKTLKFGEEEVILDVNWDVGIGGGLWSAGMLLCRQLAARQQYFTQEMQGQRVLELGSGTGLVGLSLAKLCTPAEVCITDLSDHTPLIHTNVQKNAVPTSTIVRVEDYDWCEDAPHLHPPYDWIVGTDLAYNPSLYKPLIKALEMNSDQHTITLLGVTRTDTSPKFFALLSKAGFKYYRIPDYEMEGKSDAGSVNNFGLFVIFRDPTMTTGGP